MRPVKSLAGRSVFAFLMSAVTLWWAGCSPTSSDIVVARVGDEKITLPEYEEFYLKSNGSRAEAAKSSVEDREKFLDLLTKFKLKLADAYSSNLDHDPAVESEINQYKGSLVASFLTEREVTEPGMRELYNGRKEEIRASHILLALAPNASSEDSAAAYQKAYEIIAKLKTGAPFDSLALAYSTDPSVKQNEGDLYYFTGGQMVPEFEQAAFAMKVGEISSAPVRTKYGLHIIKVVDRKPAPGMVRCSHIMIRFSNNNPSPEDTLAAYQRIKAIQDSLKMGIDFAELAKRNSEDPGSAPKGGDLDWFTRRRWIQSFDEVALTMQPGQVSGIVRTIYGYHLIKCYDRKPPKSFDESRKELQQVYQQTRFQDDYKIFMDSLKKQVNYSMNTSAATQFAAGVDSTTSTRDSAWADNIPPDVKERALFTFGPRVVTVDSVIAIIKSRSDMANVPLRAASLWSTLDKIGEQLVFQVKGETIAQEYPEFASTMKEYTDGILLYQIEQDRVWNKVSISDSALMNYFEHNRDKFMYPDRVNFTALYIATDSLASLIHAKLKNGATIDEVVAEDSIRMKQQTSFPETFKRNSSALSTEIKKSLDEVIRQLKNNSALSVQLVAHPDTSRAKAKAEKLASKRLDAIKAYVMKGLDNAKRVLALSRPLLSVKGNDGGQRRELSSLVDVEIMGRRAWVLGSPETKLLPIPSDERTQIADSLKVGTYSEPFKYKSGFAIVRLNGREPSRRKTFEEAGTEVSSNFQEYESKRIEKEWLDGLRQRFPIEENKEALKNAFESGE